MGPMVFFFLTLTATALRAFSGEADDHIEEEPYPHFPECYPLTWNDSNRNIYLVCTIPMIHNNTPLEDIVAKRLFGFYVNCTSEYITSYLRPNGLSHLHFLRELVFTGCNFPYLPSDALKNMTRLESLCIEYTQKYHQSDNPGLQLPEDFLINNHDLNKVQLTNNSIESLPSNFYCSLPRITEISMCGNRFQSLNDIGCGKKNHCCHNVLALNLSQNSLTEVHKVQLEPLAQMQELDFQYNSISLVEEGAFDSMLNLRILDLSDNQITYLSTTLLQNNLNLQHLDISNNYLTVISPQLCCNTFNFLVFYDISRNNLTFLHADTLNNSKALRLVNFSYNAFRFIPTDLFKDLYNMFQLNLDNCQIEHLTDGTFRHLHSLIILILTDNKLQSIGPDTLQGLGQLEQLDMSRNAISVIHMEAFTHCPLMQYLFLSNNKITSFPNVPVLNMLQLSLSNNQIYKIDTDLIRNMTSLTYIDLSHNLIKSIMSPICAIGQSKLQYLDLSYNDINLVSHTAFNVCLPLKVLFLNHNNFTYYDRRITYKLPSLQLLNLSHNHMQFFDYNLVPDALKYLDISYNEIKMIDDAQHGVTRLQMSALVAHHNRITRLQDSCLPRKIEVADLSYNAIQQISAYFFSSLLDLRVVDLSQNQLIDLEKYAFSLYPPRPLDHTLPKVILTGNWPNCTCRLKWLVHDYVLGMRDYVEIIKPYYCWATHERVRQFKALLNLQVPSQLLDATLLCRYSDTPTLTCPKTCTCYHNVNQNYVEVDCGKNKWDSNVTAESIALPKLTKRLFLDGNTNVQTITNIMLRNAPQLEILYINGSKIETLNTHQFEGLQELQELHLENNLLSVIVGTEFYDLVKLNKLFLHSNRLKTVNMQAFQKLNSLKLLTLHNNYLHALNTEEALNITYTISLRENHYECTCDFQHTILLWARNIEDLNQIECFDVQTNTNFSAYNDSYCEQEIPQQLHNSKITVVLSVVCGILFVVISVVLLSYIYRLEMQVWLYSRYGVRIFHHNDEQDANKQFDAFISYSSDDDEFVAHELVPRLERDAGFRLCIHQRDFPVGAIIADTIIMVVENSCRTLMVLTQNFVNSEWCRFEFKMAHHRSMQDRCCRLIVIVLEDVDYSLMDKELKLYLQTNTYLRWGDILFWEKLLFAMPNRKNTAPVLNRSTNEGSY